MNKKQQSAKKWFIKCIVMLSSAILLVGMVVYIFDPYFHFHKPFDFVAYRLYDERYANDGISRHFEYDAIITGTSMAQNFKPSEVDELFDTKCVKETFSGAGYQELSQNLERALQRNDALKKVFWTVDYNAIIREPDWCGYDNYPTYLYDDSVWNDTSYIFNKSILYHGVLPNIIMTLTGQPSTTMDEYSSWDKETGLQYILQSYNRDVITDVLPHELTAEEHIFVRENVQKNLVDLVNKYPDVTFYMFYAPYSICYWDALNNQEAIIRQLEAEYIATELLLECPNVKLYNFNDQYEMITNLHNYRDKEHYASWINTQILEWMAEDVGLVTKENYQERLKQEEQFFLNYDYDSIYE